MAWEQCEIVLPAHSRGFHLITPNIEVWQKISVCRVGLLHLFLLHTSASLCINENADPDVPVDLESGFNRLAPEQAPYRHTCEGPDDMPAHIKSALLGVDLTVPVADGRMVLGVWQGIYLCEHRNQGSRRRVVLTLQGEFS